MYPFFVNICYKAWQDADVIETWTEIRHEEKKVRRAGGRTQGPAAFTDDDRERFQRNLAQLLREALDN